MAEAVMMEGKHEEICQLAISKNVIFHPLNPIGIKEEEDTIALVQIVMMGADDGADDVEVQLI